MVGAAEGGLGRLARIGEVGDMGEAGEDKAGAIEERRGDRGCGGIRGRVAARERE